MPDWSAWVRERVGSLNLPRVTEDEIVRELAAHLEDLAEEQIAGGMDESEAFERALDQASWRGLAKNIERVKRKEEMMNRRSKQIWFPGLVTLALSMGCMMILEGVERTAADALEPRRRAPDAVSFVDCHPAS